VRTPWSQFYNKKQFDEAGIPLPPTGDWTFDEMIAIADGSQSVMRWQDDATDSRRRFPGRRPGHFGIAPELGHILHSDGAVDPDQRAVRPSRCARDQIKGHHRQPPRRLASDI